MKKLWAAFLLASCSFAFIIGCNGEQGSSLYLPINGASSSGSSSSTSSSSSSSTSSSSTSGFAGPAWVTSTKGDYSDKVGVDWALVEGAVSYKVYRNTEQTGTFTRVGTVEAAGLTAAASSMSAQYSVLSAALSVPEMRAAYVPGCMQAEFISTLDIRSGVFILAWGSYSIILQVGSRSWTVSFSGGLFGNSYSQSEIVRQFNNALGDYGLCEAYGSYLRITANEQIRISNGGGVVLMPPLKKFLLEDAGWSTVVIEDTVNTCPSDTTPPTVSSVTPTAGATGVSVSVPGISVTFSEAMAASTVTASSFTLSRGATAVAGSVATTNNTMFTFTPSAALLTNTVYTATISTAVTDSAGNHLAVSYSWNFTTTPGDVAAPTITAVTPAGGATGVSISAPGISVTFNEAMAASTVTSGFTLAAGGSPVAGSVSTADNITFTFMPSASLLNNTVYTATIATTVTDSAGNHLAVTYSWNFTTITGTVTDTTPPTVVSVSPAGGATGVSVSSAVSVSFSEVIDSSTLTASSFTLNSGGTSITGMVSNNTFTPSAALASGTTYTATITTAVTDSAGNHLAENYTWSFTTAGTQDPSHYFIDTEANGVVQGTYYYYVVTAVREDGTESYPSPISEGFALSVEAPGNVPGLTATMGTYTDRVVLTWQAAERADLYTVFRTNGTTTVQVGGDITGTTYTDTTVIPGLYKYQVVAWTSLGVKGGSSDQVLGYRGVTATEFCLEAYKEIGPVLDWLGVKASEDYTALLSDQPAVAGTLGGTFQYDYRSVDYINQRVTARIVFTDYSNYYLTLNDYMQLVAKSDGTGTISQTISVTGIYNGTIQFSSVPFAINTTDGTITFSGTSNLIVTPSGGSAESLNATILNQ